MTDQQPQSVTAQDCSFLIHVPKELDFVLLAEIERSASLCFAEIEGLAHETSFPPLPNNILNSCDVFIASTGNSPEASNSADLPGPIHIGFIAIRYLDNIPFVAKIAVRKEYQGYGVGSRLLEHAYLKVLSISAKAVLTLTTFRDVPWNGPWYAKRGFVEVSDQCARTQLGQEHVAIYERSKAIHQTDAWTWIMMARPLHMAKQ